jgi:RNA polymerase-interacting CarD/CdnL/TRCF family regulator
MGGDQLEKARDKGIQEIAKNSDIEKLRGILKGKQEVSLREKTRRSRKNISRDFELE